MSPWYQNWFNLITHPYLFFEEAIGKNNPITATIFFIIIWVFTCLGWWLVSPGFFGLNLILGMIMALFTYPLAVVVLYLLCRLLVRENRLRSFFSVWGFSYLPTFFFFIINISIHLFQKFAWFSVLINNPLFQMGLWTFIFLMLLWKILLLTITLRLAGNLNLTQIIQATVILVAIAGFYWWVGLCLGWLKMPFI